MKGLVYYSMSFSFTVMLLIQNLRSVFARRDPETSGCLPAGLFRVNSYIVSTH